MYFFTKKKKEMKTFLKLFIIPKIVVLGLGIMFNDVELFNSVIKPLEALANGELGIGAFCFIPSFCFQFTLKGLAIEVVSWFCGLAIEG